MEWKQISPVLPVANVQASIKWYQRVFGFESRIVNPPGDEVPVYAVLYRDGVSIHLLQMDEAPHGLRSPVEAQFWVDEGIDELYEQSKGCGAEVIQSLGDRFWGHRDFMVADLDRNIIWITVRLFPESE